MPRPSSRKARPVPGTDDPARRARGLARGAAAGALATLRAGDGAPVATWTSLAWDVDGSPLFLLSTLADHTRNLLADSRVSLLVVAGGAEAGARGPNPQSLARASLTGTLAADKGARVRARYLAQQPAAKLWAGFADFSFFRMRVAEVRLVGGFADAHRIAGRRFRFAARAVAPLARAEGALLARIDGDPRLLAALGLKAGLGAGAQGKAAPKAIALDPEGVTLTRAGRIGRAELPSAIFDADSWLSAIRALARRDSAG